MASISVLMAFFITFPYDGHLFPSSTFFFTAL